MSVFTCFNPLRMIPSTPIFILFLNFSTKRKNFRNRSNSVGYRLEAGVVQGAGAGAGGGEAGGGRAGELLSYI